MLHILKPETRSLPKITLQDVFDHRVSFLKSENLPFKKEEGKDRFDTVHTTYLAYQDQSYGVLGTARTVPLDHLPSEVRKEIASNQSIPFVLADCLFHIPEESRFFKNADRVVRSQFSYLLGCFHSALNTYLENQAIFRKVSAIYFFLEEETVALFPASLRERTTLLREFEDPSGETPRVLGFFNYSELVLSFQERDVLNY